MKSYFSNNGIQTFSYLQTFPAPVKVWVISEAEKGLPGIKTIAEKFIDDEKGFIGCKNASEEAKKKIMTELMKNDKIGTEIRKAIEKTKPTN